MQWKPFQFCGKIYDLAHLHPRSVTYVQSAKGDTPARVYRVDVIFGLHCFTRGRDLDVTRENTLLYRDDRETRVFDFVRYELSKRLPEIVEGLAQRKCYHTGKGNFFSVEIVREDGRVVEYDVFFVASRSSAKGKINLFVQSAYVRDANHASSRPAKKPIGFFVILFNTLNNKPIKTPKLQKNPFRSPSVEQIIGPLGYPHTWVEAIAGGISARLSPSRSYADRFEYTPEGAKIKMGARCSGRKEI